MYLVFLFFQSSLYMFQTFVFCIVGSDYHVHDYQPLKVTRTAPINMVILVIILFVMELSTSIKVIDTLQSIKLSTGITIEQNFVTKQHASPNFSMLVENKKNVQSINDFPKNIRQVVRVANQGYNDCIT